MKGKKRDLPPNVYWDKKSNTYQVRFGRNLGTDYYGTFKDKELAIAVAEQVRKDNPPAPVGPPEVAKGMALLCKYVDMSKVEESDKPRVKAAIAFLTRIDEGKQDENKGTMADASSVGRPTGRRDKQRHKQ